MIYDAQDTRINEYPDSYFKEGEERYDTFERAQEIAVEYLERLVSEVQEQLDWIKSGES